MTRKNLKIFVRTTIDKEGQIYTTFYMEREFYGGYDHHAHTVGVEHVGLVSVRRNDIILIGLPELELIIFVFYIEHAFRIWKYLGLFQQYHFSAFCICSEASISLFDDISLLFSVCYVQPIFHYMTVCKSYYTVIIAKRSRNSNSCTREIAM